MREMTLLQEICSAYRAILGGKLDGFYVHGSVAFGCFTWETGDLDFIACVNAPLTQAEKEALIRLLLDRTKDAPPKGFEMSVVLTEHCRHFVHPTPFETHFSAAHQDRAEADLTAYCRDMHGTDPDLAAHFTVLRHTGLTLYGPPARELFGEVPRQAYLDSILLDAEDAAREIANAPVYGVLNLCRVVAYLREGLVLSKTQGGQWGLAHLPAGYQALLQDALRSYRTGEAFTETAPLTAFAADVLAQLRKATADGSPSPSADGSPQIIQAAPRDLETVRQITHQTIAEIYPHHYPAGVVAFFIRHHNTDRILKDIHAGVVFLLLAGEEAVGTVTIRENEICRLFVLPSWQHHGFGSLLLGFAEARITETFPEICLDSSLPAQHLYLNRGYTAAETHRLTVESGDVLCYDLMKKAARHHDA
ncbi:MAG: GNAT family N-acetyltransferase [Clostridia bacterium]|nr:GNAT family N-acetyltransferase [Clostridia bacterium]